MNVNLAKPSGRRCLSIAIGAVGFFTLAGMSNNDNGGAAPRAAQSRGVAAATIVSNRLSGRLSPDEQAVRFRACVDRLMHYRDLGVIRRGGERPIVEQAAWTGLRAGEQAEIFDIAACIASGGQVEDQLVIVTIESDVPDIETRRVANDRNFVAEAASRKSRGPKP